MTDQTKERILDAAERLYAEQGVAATSLRTIMKAAGANIAAVHYHFGSRAGLIQALLERRAEPVNRVRLEMLDALEARHPRGPLPAEGVVRAFYQPVLELRGRPENGHISALIGRIVMEGPEPEAVARAFAPVTRRFVAAIRRAAPHLSEAQAWRRMRFVVGTMVFALNAGHGPPIMPEATGDPFADDFEDLVACAAAGLSAPAPAGKEHR